MALGVGVVVGQRFLQYPFRHAEIAFHLGEAVPGIDQGLVAEFRAAERGTVEDQIGFLLVLLEDGADRAAMIRILGDEALAGRVHKHTLQ